MKIKNIILGSTIFVVYNICCFRYIKFQRKEKNKM